MEPLPNVKVVFGVFDRAEPAIRLRTFIESFTYGAWEPVCLESYHEFFAESVTELGDACDSFEPPG